MIEMTPTRVERIAENLRRKLSEAYGLDMSKYWWHASYDASTLIRITFVHQETEATIRVFNIMYNLDNDAGDVANADATLEL